MYCLYVNVYCCHRVSTQLQLTNISISISNVFGTGIPLRGHSDVSQWPDSADYSCVHCFREIRFRAVHGFWSLEFSNNRLGASH
jgi:hypothetical protein